MSSSRTLDLVDEIVTLINAGAWTTAVIAERKYIPGFQVSELESGVKVAVVPKARSIERDSRSTNQTEYQIDIGVFRHGAGNEAARDAIVDSMVELVEELEAYFMNREIVLVADKLMVEAADTAPVYDPDMLKDSGVFGSVLTLTIMEVR